MENEKTRTMFRVMLTLKVVCDVWLKEQMFIAQISLVWTIRQTFTLPQGPCRGFFYPQVASNCRCKLESVHQVTKSTRGLLYLVKHAHFIAIILIGKEITIFSITPVGKLHLSVTNTYKQTEKAKLAFYYSLSYPWVHSTCMQFLFFKFKGLN